MLEMNSITNQKLLDVQVIGRFASVTSPPPQKNKWQKKPTLIYWEAGKIWTFIWPENKNQKKDSRYLSTCSITINDGNGIW